MTNKIIEARRLLAEIEKYDNAYFNEGTRLISDDAYDQLWFALNELLTDRDVQKALSRDSMPLGSHAITGQKVLHPVDVLSLDKLKITDDKFTQKFARFAKKTQQSLFTVQDKLDGLTIVIYRKKQPVFVTRGGGKAGEDVTHQFKNIDSIWRAALNMKPGDVVRGEAIIPKSVSDNRSQVSGIVRSKDAFAAKNNNVHLVCYQLLDHEHRYKLSETEKLNYLSGLGFETIHTSAYMSAPDMSEYLLEHALSDSVRDGDYDIDGLVVKPEYEPQGPSNGHHSFGQLAIKLAPRAAITMVRDIEWTVGKNGRLTPVAIFDPVAINNASFTRASLGSWSLAKELGAVAGSRVEVSIMNDVIPKITAVLEGAGTIDQPENTFANGAHLFVSDYTLPLADKLKLGAKIFEWAFTPKVADVISEALPGAKLSEIIMQPADYQCVLTKLQYEKIQVSLSRDFSDYGAGHILMLYGVDGFGDTQAAKLADVKSFDELEKHNSSFNTKQVKGFAAFKKTPDYTDALTLAKYLF